MSVIKLTTLIDPHVHLRDPGATKKENFRTGTEAAIAGGICVVFDMPNNSQPTISKGALRRKESIASKKAVCDYGLFFGASQKDNTKEYKKIYKRVVGLKVYMDTTTGSLLLEHLEVLKKTFKSWEGDKPIVVHAENGTLAKALGLAAIYGRKLHVAHLSQQSELMLVMDAKRKGIRVTCEVSPHHLFLTEKDADRLGPFGHMKPYLRKRKDLDFLWKNIAAIDCVATDHAPHMKAEKESDNPPFGVPGVETSLPLMLTAVNKGRLSIKELMRLMSIGPQKIFQLNLKSDDYVVEIDMDYKYKLRAETMHSKCGWTPFEGWKVKGKVKKVIIRGNTVFENGRILAKAGFGRNIYDK